MKPSHFTPQILIMKLYFVKTRGNYHWFLRSRKGRLMACSHTKWKHLEPCLNNAAQILNVTFDIGDKYTDHRYGRCFDLVWPGGVVAKD